MTTTEKFTNICNWFSENLTEDCAKLEAANKTNKLSQIEYLIGQKLPESFKELYRNLNGDSGNGKGAFLGHSFLSIDSVISILEFSKTSEKPVNRKIINPSESDKIICKIVKEYTDNIPVYKWYKLEFQCSPDSLGGTYLYEHENMISKAIVQFTLNKAAEKNVLALSKQLHDLEKEHYNWDKLSCTVYKTGEIGVERTDLNSERKIPFTSYPEKAIKQKYINVGWVPFIVAPHKNFIGIDLDPDEKGVKGQVIVFGRDEVDKFVIKNSLDDFLDYILEEIENQPEIFLKGSHLHDVFKELAMPKVF